MMARILIIAGSDSGGGAGIQADIKTVTMLGGHAMTAITALTAQNTLGVDGVMPVPPDFVMQQVDSVVRDIGIDAVKIGMLGGADIAGRIVDWLDVLDADFPVVFDPVMVATSGALLIDEPTLQMFDRLLRRATLVTPNVPELAALTGAEIVSTYTLERAARQLSRQYRCAVLAKGGHLPGDTVSDLLIEASGAAHRWVDDKINTVHNHGTGCTLASGVATGLGQGMAMAAATDRARRFVREALRLAPALGGGHGPMGHGLVRLEG
jgi:hydroxymethylpyrimidine/phosphomethylpyrimidine kinase